MVAAVSNSAVGILALLEEEDYTLKAHALEKLNVVVDSYWAEIADAIPLIESLSDDDMFPHRELAASIASKCFFHLEEYSDALRLALGAGSYFDVNVKSQYTDTIIATCIDEYIAIRVQENPEAEKSLDPRLTAVVERMFERCYASGEYKQALGVALEARRLDQVNACIVRSANVSGMLSYCFDICRTVVSNRPFRMKVYEVMVQIYKTHSTKDYSGVCQCLQMLNNYKEVTAILEQLVRSNEPNDCLIAYQVAFDLAENENQKFMMNIYRALPSQVTEGTSTEATTTGENPEYWEKLDKLKLILSGEFLVDLTLDFMHRSNGSDPLLMATIKTAIENRNSVLHHSAVVAHSYMNAGTTNDSFLRENLEWLGKATNWAKFTATASLGVVHKGHVRESMNLLAPYLPQGGTSPSPYSEGGALYAMGLIHANKGSAGQPSKTTTEYLRNALKNASDETVQHGACLGIGLCGLASHDLELYEELKTIMLTDSAVAGEGAGIAIGLVLLGAGNDVREGEILKDLLAYAHDTKHEKIIRGAMMGIALMMFEREEQADTLVEQLLRDKDPLIRYGGIFATAMAYVGTSNNSAVRRLLHVAVSDVSDDVRRAAVMCLGFVLFRSPVQVPKLVSLLAESFNPHVRYGACLAVGIACAGTAKNEAIQLLEPLIDDPVDYVRQGALMSLAMVLMQESEGRNTKVKEIREKILKLITDKHVTTMTKMGAIIAQGILGANDVVISLQSHMGFTKASSVVGLAIWAQHWFWYPLFHFLELSFQPTLCIGVNKDLKLPKNYTLQCNAKQSMFAPPKRMEEKKEEKKELVATAVLSTTVKARARQAKHDANQKKAEEKSSEVKEEEKKESTEAMDVDQEGAAAPSDDAAVANKVVKEPLTHTLTTPARVTLAQEPFMAFDTKQRYIPVMYPHQRAAGIIVLRDTTPTEQEEVESVKMPTAAGVEEEADPPEPFEWTPPDASQ